MLSLISYCIFFACILGIFPKDSLIVSSEVTHYYRWLTIEAAQQYLDELIANENGKEVAPERGKDRRNSTPIITGDAFRILAQPHLCDETNRCRFDPSKMTPGA